ncbi:MAG: hypothetical protein HEQ35_20310 [Gloeotrichia echinulata IR180]
MKITQIFQRLIALVALVAFTFGFAAHSASAAHLFKAPCSAKTNVKYFGDTEVGITVYNAALHQTVLWCNNYYNQGAGIEWKTSCTSEQKLDPSENYVVQGFFKPTKPSSSTRWQKVKMHLTTVLPENNRYSVPAPTPGKNHYVITMFNGADNVVATMTLEGLNLGFQGEGKPNCKQIPKNKIL